MDLAGDGLRQRPHARPRHRIGGHQAHTTMGLVQIFDDGHRLRQARAVGQLQQRHELIGGHRSEGLAQMLALRQVNRNVLIGQALSCKAMRTRKDAEERK
jgi:hypothetical protein